jgi:hypothetical protein
VGYQDNFNKIADATLSVFGVPVTYTPAGGTPKDIRAIVELRVDLDDKQWQTAVAAVAIGQVDCADVATPNPKDTIKASTESGIQKIGAETWTVSKILGRAGNLWQVQLERDIRPTFKRAAG